MLSVNKQLQSDIDLDLTIGYAISMAGTPYRYSNVTIHEFEVTKIADEVISIAQPTITCDGTHVYITTTTENARIYYQLNSTGNYYKYTGPIAIAEDTVVKAFAYKDGWCSSIRTQTCVYDVGIVDPVISCNGIYVTITCATANSTIYYKLGASGEYTEYSSPIHISDDVTVYAYATTLDATSNTVSQECTYNSGIAAPVIVCDGQTVNISCATANATVYYKINDGSWIDYFMPIEIESTVTVYAYATKEGEHSATVSQSCVYVPGVAAPIISCENNTVTITCSTQGATIHYREGDTGSFSVYNAALPLSATETIYAYASKDGNDSITVSQECIYVPPVHDYSQDYLTFKVIDGGTILWKAFGSLTKTIEYKINNGN